MQHKHIIRSLPLLASILGSKYGVEVRIGGDRAYTDGSVIQLPSLPLEADDILLGLIRGYTDHESAHIRDTDFAALKAAKLPPLEKHLWNIIEDWRVENCLVEHFPGCRENFTWLIRYLFLPKQTGHPKPQQAEDTATGIVEWLLLTVRSWDVPKLAEERDRLRSVTEKNFPGLVDELDAAMGRIRQSCPDTQSTIAHARQLAKLIRNYVSFLERESPETAEQSPSQSADSGETGPTALQSLHELLVSGADTAVGDIGSMLGEALSQACEQAAQRIRVAVPTGKSTRALSEQEIRESRQAATALRARLHGILQSRRSVRNRSSFTGKIDPRALHRLATGNGRIFLRRGQRIAVNTALHILLDASGSMSGRSMALAGQACFALASALHGIPGLSLGVTAFPGNQLQDGEDEFSRWQTVAPILPQNGKMHNYFGLNAVGNTPLDSALWWLLPQLLPRSEPRKIILIITDGKPDNGNATLEAIRCALGLGMEVYGIGICTLEIQKLLPESSQVITSIYDLTPALFTMLQRALVRE